MAFYAPLYFAWGSSKIESLMDVFAFFGRIDFFFTFVIDVSFQRVAAVAYQVAKRKIVTCLARWLPMALAGMVPANPTITSRRTTT